MGAPISLAAMLGQLRLPVALLLFVAGLDVGCLGNHQRPAMPSKIPAPRASDPVSDLYARILKLAGTTPVECGRHLVKTFGTPSATSGALEASLACGTSAVASGGAFWVLVQHSGIDSWVATGLVGSSGRPVQHFSYDSAPCAGPCCDPRLTVRPCPNPSVHTFEDGRIDFRCESPALKWFHDAHDRIRPSPDRDANSRGEWQHRRLVQ